MLESWLLKSHSSTIPFFRYFISATLPILSGTYSFFPQESFPPGLIHVLTPSLGNKYLFKTNQATTIAASTKTPSIDDSFTLSRGRI
jgi:hypothetical protein